MKIFHRYRRQFDSIKQKSVPLTIKQQMKLKKVWVKMFGRIVKDRGWE